MKFYTHIYEKYEKKNIFLDIFLHIRDVSVLILINPPPQSYIKHKLT